MVKTNSLYLLFVFWIISCKFEAQVAYSFVYHHSPPHQDKHNWRGGEGFTSAVLSLSVMNTCRSMCAHCCAARACAETRRGERHRNATVSFPDPTWYLDFFICLTGKAMHKPKHTRTHIFIYIYILKKLPRKKGTFSRGRKRASAQAPFFVYVCTCIYIYIYIYI